MVQLTVLDPVNYKKFLKGKDSLIISYCFGSTPFGKCVIGIVGTKICHFSFVSHSENKHLEILKKEWPDASFEMDAAAGKSMIDKIFEDKAEMEVIVRGTAFQEKVWTALLDIKKGQTCFYGDVANAIGCPTATRAVANAIAKNPVAYLVPCHRVICKNGDIYKYSSGCLFKKKLLEYEGFLK